jgi:hypothetical protein
MFLAATSSALATVHYVWQSSPGPAPPFLTWATAATTIQDAVDAAVAGDEIVVTNGTYATGSRVVYSSSYGGTMTNRVAVDKPLALRSVDGPQATVIDAGSAVGCVYLTNGATLFGFTLTNGLAGVGSGVYCESTSAVLSNCVLSGNSAFYGYGGGAVGGTLNHCTLTGNSDGGAYGGTLNNCTLSGNSGGGAYDCTLNNCTLTGNSADSGGGAGDSTLNNCTLSGNSANGSYNHFYQFVPGLGGGACGCTLNNCTLTGNSANSGGGAYGATLNNCALTGNTANGIDYDGIYFAGLGGGAYSDSSQPCTLNNCTLTGNSASDDGGGAYDSTLNNCIVYFNSDTNGGNYDPSSTLNYCCTTPLPTTGVGNISADPQLASASHLSAESPCIGAGSATYTSGTDIDGEAWANPPSIGCDEYHAGAVTGPLTVSLTATLTNVSIGYPVGLTAFIAGRTDLSVWDFGDGFVEVNEPYTSHAWTAPGDYLVALWAYNESYPGGVSARVTVHVEEGLHYVAATSGNPVAPYTSWATAATNIQDAVDVALPGATILVTNGVYAPVTVNTPLTLQSVHGPAFTVIDGLGTNQCLYLTNDAVMVGFTLTNGVADNGGGVYCESTSGVLSNCVLSGNSAMDGGGAYGGTLNNCTLTGNSGSGASSCTLNNCTLTGNSAFQGGGAYGGTLNNCTLSGNSAPDGEGGGAADSTLNNCTLTGNSAGEGGGAEWSTLNNCIVYFNSCPNGGNCNYDASSTLNYCCTTPMPTNGVGIITNPPLFVDYTGGNLRLQSNSPCINSGNNAYVVGSTDLDGNPRIVGGTVDIGAYEYQTSTSIISYAWLQQYGLPTDGSADYADMGGNGMNNWQKWIAGLNPTDASSVLRMTSATKTNNPAGLVVTWESVNTRTYYLQSSTNLGAQPAFFTIQSNIVGQAGTTSYTDTTATNAGPYFYRVGVGQ